MIITMHTTQNAFPLSKLRRFFFFLLSSSQLPTLSPHPSAAATTTKPLPQSTDVLPTLLSLFHPLTLPLSTTAFPHAFSLHPYLSLTNQKSTKTFPHLTTPLCREILIRMLLRRRIQWWVRIQGIIF
jgi:hypothetical protein